MENEASHIRRNLVLLTLAQALGASSPPIIISLGGLVGRGLIENQAWATLPVSIYQAGMALCVLPAALTMKVWGRRNAYLLGGLFGVLSGLFATMGIVAGSFLLFCSGTLLAGIYGAYVQSYRFAATDTAPTSMRNKAISLIMVGGLAAAIIGPQLVIWTRDAYEGISFAGSFLSQTALALVALPILAMLKMPVVRIKSDKVKSGGGRTIVQILSLRSYILAVVAGAVSYGLMSFLMTVTPMAMHDHHHTVAQSTVGIQWHILAMYGPSFFTGYVINRFGAERVTAVGLILIMMAAVFGLSGYEVYHFYTALITLGLGWNFGFIGATSMIAAYSTPEDRVKVQGINDLIIFGSVAICSFSSGALLSASGWTTINLIVFPIVIAILVPLLWFGRDRQLKKPF